MEIKLFGNEAGKKTRLVFVVMAALLFTVPVFSQQQAAPDHTYVMQVKYLASDNDGMLFNLKYNNDSGDKFKLMVLNGNGDVLFQDNYSGKKIRKRIRLARLTDTDNVTFLIRPAKENIQLSCKVKVKDKVVDEPADPAED